MIHYEKIAPMLLIVLSLVSSAVYFTQGDIRRTIYWIAGAVITASVTF
jgi:hypothetical protein